MTNKLGILERSVIKSSVIPSLKYSCPGSPLRFVKGSTTREGLLGNGNAGACAAGRSAVGTDGRRERYCTATTNPKRISNPATARRLLGHTRSGGNRPGRGLPLEYST